MVSRFERRGGVSPRVAVIREQSSIWRRRAIVGAVQALFALGAVAVVTTAASPSAWAQDAAKQITERRDYRIAAGPLDSVLNSFAGAAGIELVAGAELTRGKASSGLSGSYTVAEGFGELLRGQGVEVVRGSNGTYSLRAAAAAAAIDGNTLPEVAVSADRDADLTSEGTKSYAARGTGILKGSSSLRDIPQSISVMTRQRLDDQKLTEVSDMLMQTAGISRSSSGLGNHVYLSRGFEIRNFETDGVPTGFWTQGGSGIAGDTSIYDRVEILRGAPGLLLGNGQPAGVVNFVRKRPLAETQVDIDVQAGSWGKHRAVLDATGALNEDKTLRGRAVVGYDDHGVFNGDTRSTKTFFYGVLEYDLSNATKLGLGYRHQQYREHNSTAGGIPYSSNGSDLNLPRSISYAQPWAHNYTNVDELFGDVKHRINDRWDVTASATWLRSTWDYRGMYMTGTLNPTTGSGAYLFPYYFDDTHTNAAADMHVNGRFDLFGREHKLTFGANILREHYDSSTYSGYASRVAISTVPTTIAMPAAGEFSPGVQTETAKGLYGNVQLQLADRLKAIVGGRLSWYSFDDNYDGDVSSYKQAHQFTPYAALIYDLNPEWSAYASYTDIFLPQSSYKTASGAALDPAVGSNYELGVKGELFDKRLNTSLALFLIRQNNRYQIDPENPTICPGVSNTSGCYINGGEVESKGIEAQVDGEVMPGWQMSAGYTFNSQYYVKDRTSTGAASTNEGKKFSTNTPKHIFRAWTTYRLPREWSKLTVGGGVTSQSEMTYTNTAGTKWTQKGYAVWNGFARYEVDKTWSISLNLNNIFDRRYYIDNVGSYYGEPRNVTLSLHARM